MTMQNDLLLLLAVMTIAVSSGYVFVKETGWKSFFVIETMFQIWCTRIFYFIIIVSLRYDSVLLAGIG